MSDYNRTFNGEAKIKLTQLFNEGMTVMQEVEDLTAGLNDTIKAIAEELEIKPINQKIFDLKSKIEQAEQALKDLGIGKNSDILKAKKALKIAHKAGLTDTNKDHDELNTILETVGKIL